MDDDGQINKQGSNEAETDFDNYFRKEDENRNKDNINDENDENDENEGD